MLLIIIGIIVSLFEKPTGGNAGGNGDGSEATEQLSSEELLALQRKEMLETADYQTLTYDYDSAIATNEAWEGYAEDEELVNKIAEIQAIKDSCVRVNMEDVTHIFYHSLVVDPERAFSPDIYQGQGNYEWMTTIHEFNAITQEMYD